eukprot:CAMPEP_0184495390 /NCGR_PEP_ID=MMETSP0113_2-20130426/31146_1 /TAXON_ID=91329 /ORGANISM="Norrisiella sphaerica, Strain BC52" /LENGTH=710 /DNA_ID=CAMNT_0026881557 /DNA_START=106 /DNA_END=2238 /DNA_ORIENTATION=-
MLHIRRILQSRLSTAAISRVRHYTLGTNAFHESFKDLPKVNRQQLRDSALKYLETFDHKSWYDDPIRTVINGVDFRKNGNEVDTFNAFNEKNGSQIMSSKDTMEALKDHMKNFKPYQFDNREKARAIEKELFGPLAGELIGNQAMDFKKQDGVTEIEESLEASEIERRLNDMLFKDEELGKITIKRDPAFVSCVSNFSNFLDLSRKVLRNIEIGVPVVILSRTNTSQHMFRWTQLLLDCMEKHSLELGLVSFASCSVEMQKDLFHTFTKSPIYFTGSREVARALKSMLSNTFSSTGGPNTFVSKVMNHAIEEAMRTSALIENSGQCTALRHAVLPRVTDKEVHDIFSRVSTVKDEREALTNGTFASLFSSKPFTETKGYQAHSTYAVEYKVQPSLPVEIEEHWRKAILDVTSVDEQTLESDEFKGRLGQWLVDHQPISLAVNGDSYPFDFTRTLFERTALVVYTLGSIDKPALTAQARPQDGEIFGEVPPRKQLNSFTKFPVVVPSPSAAYNAAYIEDYLFKMALDKDPDMEFLQPLLDRLPGMERGYANLIVRYLREACQNGPREGFGVRTSLYGLQRPPLDGSLTIVRAEGNIGFEETLLALMPFLVTNARNQALLSVPNGSNLAGMFRPFVRVVEQNHTEFKEDSQTSMCYNAVYPVSEDFPIVSHFVSKFLPFGHVKSTASNHKEFLDSFKESAKWLKFMSPSKNI